MVPSNNKFLTLVGSRWENRPFHIHSILALSYIVNIGIEDQYAGSTTAYIILVDALFAPHIEKYIFGGLVNLHIVHQ